MLGDAPRKALELHRGRTIDLPRKVLFLLLRLAG